LALLAGASSDQYGIRRTIDYGPRKEAPTVQWDLGFQGLGLLILMSVIFGVLVHLVLARRTTAWMGAIASAAYFVGGLLASEVWFGWATQEELQPNINGLSFDEALLIGLLFGAVAVFATWLVTRQRPEGGHQPTG
jgi:hypothetical protein